MPGALHKINLDLAPPQFEALFPKLGRTVEHLFRQRLRYWRPLHSKQLYTHATFPSSQVFKRSTFGLVHCYNALPQRLADLDAVKTLQRCRQAALLRLAELGAEDWPKLSRAYGSGPRVLNLTNYSKCHNAELLRVGGPSSTIIAEPDLARASDEHAPVFRVLFSIMVIVEFKLCCRSHDFFIV